MGWSILFVMMILVGLGGMALAIGSTTFWQTTVIEPFAPLDLPDRWIVSGPLSSEVGNGLDMATFSLSGYPQTIVTPADVDAAVALDSTSTLQATTGHRFIWATGGAKTGRLIQSGINLFNASGTPDGGLGSNMQWQKRIDYKYAKFVVDKNRKFYYPTGPGKFDNGNQKVTLITIRRMLSTSSQVQLVQGAPSFLLTFLPDDIGTVEVTTNYPVTFNNDSSTTVPSWYPSGTLPKIPVAEWFTLGVIQTLNGAGLAKREFEIFINGVMVGKVWSTSCFTNFTVTDSEYDISSVQGCSAATHAQMLQWHNESLQDVLLERDPAASLIPIPKESKTRTWALGTGAALGAVGLVTAGFAAARMNKSSTV
jgi:hypothetical protein